MLTRSTSLAWEVSPHSWELRAPLGTARGRYTERRGFLLRVSLEGQWTGLGEATPLPEFGTESLDECARALDAATRALSEASAAAMPSSPADVTALLEGVLAGAVRGRPAARHGLELALLDALARRRGLPLAQWLGHGRARTVVAVNALIASQSAAAVEEEARERVVEGFRTLKLKVGGSLEEDAARVAAARRGAGPGVALRVDANGAWSAREAREALAALQPFGVVLCEQPVGADDVAGLEALRGRLGCEVAADETLSLSLWRNAVLDGPLGPCVDWLVLKPMVLGGLLPALELARRAHARGVGAYVTSSLDGVVARAGAAHLAAMLPGGREAAHGLATGALLSARVGQGGPLREPPDGLAPQGGVIALTGAPGLGLEVDG